MITRHHGLVTYAVNLSRSHSRGALNIRPVQHHVADAARGAQDKLHKEAKDEPSRQHDTHASEQGQAEVSEDTSAIALVRHVRALHLPQACRAA